VHRLLGEELEHGGADVAARDPAAAATTVPGRPVLGRSRVVAAWVVVAQAGVPALALVEWVHRVLLDVWMTVTIYRYCHMSREGPRKFSTATVTAALRVALGEAGLPREQLHEERLVL
jgi:hypothetical protein